jgi:hypothetical protein
MRPPFTQRSSGQPGRPHVLIAAAGVAGLDTPLALRAPPGDRVIEIDPQPFRQVPRGVLLTGGLPRYSRSGISGGVGDDSTISGEALWWPPNKLAGRYLGPYLSSKVGAAAEVMPRDVPGIPIETALDPDAPGELLVDLSDTSTSRRNA